MRKKTRSILEELTNIGRKDFADEFIQTTGASLIESTVNLFSKIYETYDPATAQDLERRFINAIRSNNPKKFKTGIDKIIESKEK